jgi:hypothetical protein
MPMLRVLYGTKKFFPQDILSRLGRMPTQALPLASRLAV